MKNKTVKNKVYENYYYPNIGKYTLREDESDVLCRELYLTQCRLFYFIHDGEAAIKKIKKTPINKLGRVIDSMPIFFYYNLSKFRSSIVKNILFYNIFTFPILDSLQDDRVPVYLQKNTLECTTIKDHRRVIERGIEVYRVLLEFCKLYKATKWSSTLDLEFPLKEFRTNKNQKG